MPQLVQDVRTALRALGRRPGLSSAIVVMLAFGIAGNTALFSLFQGLFLDPLPFEQASRLVRLDETAPSWDLEYVGIAYPDFEAWRDSNSTFEAMAVFDSDDANLSLDGTVDRVDVARVTADMPRVLRIEPHLGRHFTVEEDRPGGERVAMLGHHFWRNRFAGREQVLGQTLSLDGEPYVVVGVLPESAVFVGDADLWVPLATSSEESAGSWWLSGLGRLRDGTTRQQALADLASVHRSQIEIRPANEATSPVVEPVLERMLGRARSGTTALFAAVGVVLLMACGNVAGLLLAAATVRAPEMGLRAALGASRGRLIRQLLVESLLLALVGGALGAALGYGGLRLLLTWSPEDLPRFLSFDLDLPFLLFAGGIVVVVALVFGWLPALRSSRPDLRAALHGASSRASMTRGERRLLQGLVVGEVALALVLLIASGLFLESFRSLLEVDPGFRPQGSLTYRLSLPELAYDTDEKRLAYFSRHLEQVRGLAGVEAAGAVTSPPLGGHWGMFVEIEGEVAAEKEESRPVVLTRVVSPGYFRAMGVELLGGRTLEESDGSEAERVAVVNESFARRFWPEDEQPLGRRFRFAGEDNPWMRVVGVAGDVKHYGLDRPMRPGLYVPMQQVPVESMTVVLRTPQAPLSLVEPARRLVRELDPELPMYAVSTMQRQLEESLWARRAGSWLLGIFTAFALLLALGGIYGVASYSVGLRTRELCIRMALGAQRGSLLRLVVVQGLRLLAFGVVIGLLGGLFATRAMSSLLFGAGAGAAEVFAVVTLLLLLVATLANLVPARRAVSLDPMRVLRSE